MKTFTHIPLNHDIALNQVQSNSGRFYQSPKTNLWYPSVTTVTGYASKAFFDEWRKKPENQLKSKSATFIGEELHTIVERYIKNEKDLYLNKSLISINLFEGIREYLSRIDNITLQEKSLYSDYLKMAGRVDCVGYYEDELSIIDFKTASKSKKEDWILNYFEQATCYSLMYEELFKIPVKQIVIMITTMEGEIQIFKKRSKNYYRSLDLTIKDYWKHNDFEKIQNEINGR